MGEYSDEYLKKTIEVWQPHFKEKLTKEQAREICNNVLGLYKTILESEIELKKKEEEK